MVAHLMRIDAQMVEQCLCNRTISTGVGNRGSTYLVPNNVDSAYYARDALAKAVYSKLFDWIVFKVNQKLQIDDPDAYLIGILDIYGFEIFAKNGFEQARGAGLCVPCDCEHGGLLFVDFHDKFPFTFPPPILLSFVATTAAQLCINYVNEKLQQIFIELTLKSEQEE